MTTTRLLDRQLHTAIAARRGAKLSAGDVARFKLTLPQPLPDCVLATLMDVPLLGASFAVDVSARQGVSFQRVEMAIFDAQRTLMEALDYFPQLGPQGLLPFADGGNRRDILYLLGITTTNAGALYSWRAGDSSADSTTWNGAMPLGLNVAELPARGTPLGLAPRRRLPRKRSGQERRAPRRAPAPVKQQALNLFHN